MKKSQLRTGILATCLIFFVFTFAIIAGNPKEKQPIPADLKDFLRTSCMPCHADGGVGGAKAFLNLSKWDNYSGKKQAKKSEWMCKAVKEGRMPLKSIREAHPETIPTEIQINRLCGWSASLQNKK